MTSSSGTATGGLPFDNDLRREAGRASRRLVPGNRAAIRPGILLPPLNGDAQGEIWLYGASLPSTERFHERLSP
jgi:hypothetical protein